MSVCIHGVFFSQVVEKIEFPSCRGVCLGGCVHHVMDGVKFTFSKVVLNGEM